MYFIKQRTRLSLKAIGTCFTGRDHSTVLYAIQTVYDLKETDKKYADNIKQLDKLLAEYENVYYKMEVI